MMFAAALLLIAAASGGFIMARKIFRGAMPPAHLILGHGLLVVPALAVAAYSASRPEAPSLAKTAIAVLLAAAVGGFLLLAFHVRSTLPPKAFVVVHGVAAVAGIACLLIAALA
jgi:hypothetical protein